jgi:hypothetical protein
MNDVCKLVMGVSTSSVKGIVVDGGQRERKRGGVHWYTWSVHGYKKGRTKIQIDLCNRWPT